MADRVKFISAGGELVSTLNSGNWFSEQLGKRAKEQAAEAQAIVKAYAAFDQMRSRSGKNKSVSSDFLFASARCYSNWLVKLSDEKFRGQVSKQANRSQAMRKHAAEIQAAERRAIEDRVAEERAISEQRERAFNALQEAERQSMLAQFQICHEETRIERGWKKMERWSAEKAQLPKDKWSEFVETRIRPVAEEIQAAAKTIHRAVEEIQTAEEQQHTLREQVQEFEETLENINAVSRPLRYHRGNEKVITGMKTLQARSMAIFFRYPELFLAGIMVTASAGNTLVGALIGGVLLGVSFAPPILAVIIAGLLYLTQRATATSKPPRCPRHSFFSADDEHTVAIAARTPSLMNEKDTVGDDNLPDPDYAGDKNPMATISPKF